MQVALAIIKPEDHPRPDASGLPSFFKAGSFCCRESRATYDCPGQSRAQGKHYIRAGLLGGANLMPRIPSRG